MPDRERTQRFWEKTPVQVALVGGVITGVFSLLAAWRPWENGGAERPVISQFQADPHTIQEGQSATLQWSAEHATRAEIIPGFGTVATGGSLPVTPRETTTYLLVAEGPGGSQTASTVVNVGGGGSTLSGSEPAPSISRFVADPRQIREGESATLSWSVDQANQVEITELGSVGARGSRTVSPRATTTYVLSAEGPGGAIQGSATLNVARPVTTPAPEHRPPTVKGFRADPNPVVEGKPVTLNWSTSDASLATIDPGLGSVPTTGSRRYLPKSTRVLTLTATGPGGSSSASLVIRVVPESVDVTLKLDKIDLVKYSDRGTTTWTFAVEFGGKGLFKETAKFSPERGFTTYKPRPTAQARVTVPSEGATLLVHGVRDDRSKASARTLVQPTMRGETFRVGLEHPEALLVVYFSVD